MDHQQIKALTPNQLVRVTHVKNSPATRRGHLLPKKALWGNDAIGAIQLATVVAVGESSVTVRLERHTDQIDLGGDQWEAGGQPIQQQRRTLQHPDGSFTYPAEHVLSVWDDAEEQRMTGLRDQWRHHMREQIPTAP